ncbi:MAG: tRNA (N6-isopentenyl adenosine(37)-C2)-methylthiotransferase MiaB [Planctomycetes bacterium RBG_13_62_9]|nr:MAG: tRNA (N6-isopentenyl adenosine(37)-C2)-methylthiotransferase MiaB [Planctomycetes bacterium RBG_13_62_9]
MKSLSVHIESFGCQMNKLDTALVGSALQEAGFHLTDSIQEADVVLINTCSVRQHAEDRVLSHLGHLKHLKEHRPDMVVGVIGCMAQRLGDKLLDHEAVSLVCGPAQIPQIADLIRQALAHNEKQLAVTERIRQPAQAGNGSLDSFELAHSRSDGQLPGQAFVRVMRGCNYFCTYCVVPYVRGPEACRSPEAILEQVRRLADSGIKQVTLLGQTVNSYKYRNGEKTYSLADLLDMTAQVAGIEWVRFVTSYPADEFYDEILQVMANSPKVCRYLHMPAQSGSDEVLRAMNRHYTAAHYLDLIDRARLVVPDIAVAGDFIVGFPGETEDDFQATVDLTCRARYKNCFVFKYSPRPGTTADKRLTDSVPDEVKQQRIVELLAVQEQISGELNQAFLGRQVTILVEGLSKKAHVNPKDGGDHPQLMGRTSADHIVVFNGPVSLAGQFAQVRITRTSPLTLFGELSV